ncbi:NADH-quinone oxidoreductase subunit C [Egibacter rhizosphaerae]|nr:NADH-quinone oxidoreductase subunit C [Egibacter rhizosphaerae]
MSEADGDEVERHDPEVPATKPQPSKHRMGGPGTANPNMAGGEATQLRELWREDTHELDPELAALRDHIFAAFGDLDTEVFRGELTFLVEPERLPDLVRFCKEDADVRCELLSDLSGVHWPGGSRVERAAETTGWPNYETEESEGRIEVDYIMRSITHNHVFRIRTHVSDEEPRMGTVTDLYSAALFMEREVYDMFGVVFEGHPELVRILMPEEWEGHPHRKDYPLGGVEIQYKGGSISPPDQRQY